MNVLFVCNQAQHRSPTAEEIFSEKYDTNCAGIYSEDKPVTAQLMKWADTIVCMEEVQRKWIVENYGKYTLSIRLVVLEIPDVYRYMQEELITQLQNKMKQYRVIKI